MIIQIDNICPDFFLFWEQAQGLDLSEQRRLWNKLYEGKHQDIFEVYYRHWGTPAYLEKAFGKFPQALSKIRENFDNLENRISHIVNNCAQVFAIPEKGLNFVVMVGLFTSDGWVTNHRNKLTIFLALEHIAAPRYLDILLAHESAHNFHFQSCSEERWTDFAIGEALFLEGLAIVASAMACPGLAEVEYLALGMAGDEWLTECTRRWPEIHRRFQKDLNRTDDKLYAVYFGGRGEDLGLPKRTGYFVGYRVVTYLNQRYTISEMAHWLPGRAVDEVKQALEEMN